MPHMPYRGDVFAKDHFYHIFNRGAGKDILFFNAVNYEYLLRLVKRYHQKHNITVIAYCLMPNHYHFLLRQDSDEPLSKFINVLFNAYVQAVNQQQNRKGTLFEGRFRHVWIDRDEYLIHLCRYIHQNPVKAGLVTQPENWPYSNYLDWIGKRNGTLIDRSFVQEYFASAEEYRQFVHNFQDEQVTQSTIKDFIWD